MASSGRESRANQRLTTALRTKCGRDDISVSRIRPGAARNCIEVSLQSWPTPVMSVDLGDFIVQLDFELQLGPGRGVFDDDIVDAVAVAFPCNVLR